MRVTGYLDGVLYTIETDPAATPVEFRGIITHASPPRVVSALAPLVDTEVPITPVGPAVMGTLDTDEGILAMLGARTEVVTVTNGPTLIDPDTEPMVH